MNAPDAKGNGDMVVLSTTRVIHFSVPLDDGDVGLLLRGAVVVILEAQEFNWAIVLSTVGHGRLWFYDSELRVDQ